MQLWTEWWVWMCIAVVFAILEVVIPAWVFLGFALGAAALGGLVLLKVVAFGLAGSILAFAVLSVAAFSALAMQLSSAYTRACFIILHSPENAPSSKHLGNSPQPSNNPCESHIAQSRACHTNRLHFGCS